MTVTDNVKKTIWMFGFLALALLPPSGAEAQLEIEIISGNPSALIFFSSCCRVSRAMFSNRFCSAAYIPSSSILACMAGSCMAAMSVSKIIRSLPA